MHLHARRAHALTALFALLSPSAAGLALCVHLLSDHHDATHLPEAAGVEIAVHGHAHVEGTPAHGHPVLGSGAAPLPGRWLVQAAAFAGAVREAVPGDPLGRRALSWDSPTDDPPPRRAALPVLRI